MGNETWQESGLFPRVTLCDFEVNYEASSNFLQFQVREMGQVVNHTVQCVLLLNLFTEKVFILLYAWFVVLVTFTILNLISWITAIFSSASREHFIFIHLEMSQDEDFDTDAGNLKKGEKSYTLSEITSGRGSRNGPPLQKIPVCSFTPRKILATFFVVN